jgi:TRAP-type C4-dicarboxylate transport system permease small subunit
LRRKVLLVLVVLTIGFLALYAYGSWETFRQVQRVGVAIFRRTDL